MNETCDRCGPAVRAVYRVDRVGVLYLCAHCANQFWPALWVQGWTIWLTGGNDPGRKLRGGPRQERQHSPWR